MNTGKLLRAFIEASGFEIEETPTAKSINNRNYAIASGCTFVPEIDYDYKVTKRDFTDYISSEDRLNE